MFILCFENKKPSKYESTKHFVEKFAQARLESIPEKIFDRKIKPFEPNYDFDIKFENSYLPDCLKPNYKHEIDHDFFSSTNDFKNGKKLKHLGYFLKAFQKEKE